MDGIVVFLVVVLGLLLGMPVVALMTARGVGRRQRELEARLELLAARAEAAEQRATRAERRLNALDVRLTEAVSAPAAPVPATAPARPAPGAISAELRPADAEPFLTTSAFTPPPGTAAQGVPALTERAPEPAPATSALHVPPGARASTSASPPLPVQAPSASSQPGGIDWERLVGVRLFAWLGGAALFLAAALFLHYSIQQELIAPPIRVTSGLLFGALCLFGGDRLRERTPLAAHAVSGAGVAISYAALFAARSLYQLIDTVPAFAGMALVTVTAGAVAVRRDAYFVALLGLVGGMATPYLLSTGRDRPVALFVYVALLSGGVAFVARRQRWPSLGLLGLGGAAVLALGWSVRYLDAQRAPYLLGATAVVAALYALVPVRPHGPPATPLARALSALAALSPFVTALAVGRGFEVAPFVLSLHLLLVSALVLAVERHAAFRLGLVAAGATVLVWLVRIDTDLFPAHELTTYGSMLLVPVGYFVGWLVRRRTGDHSLEVPLLLVLGGSAFWLVAARQTPSVDTPFSLALGFAAVNALLLTAMAAMRARGLPSLLGQASLLIALAACGATAPLELQGRAALLTLLAGTVWLALPLTSRRLRADATAWLGASVALPLHFGLCYLLADTWSSTRLGVLSLLGGALSAGMLAAARERVAPEVLAPRRLAALFGAGALGFVTAAVPILLENQWLTVSWALELLAVCWLYRRVPERGLLWFAWLLALAVGARLLLNPALLTYQARSATPILNHFLYTFGLPIACCFAAVWVLRGDRAAHALRLPAALSVLGTLLAFALLNIEIADYFSYGPTLSFEWGGGSLAEDMAYSLGWGAFGTLLLVAGIAFGQRAARIGALFVLVLTIGKVCLHDLWALGSLYRVGSIIGLAVALLGVSYLTQRFVLTKENA